MFLLLISRISEDESLRAIRGGGGLKGGGVEADVGVSPQHPLLAWEQHTPELSLRLVLKPCLRTDGRTDRAKPTTGSLPAASGSIRTLRSCSLLTNEIPQRGTRCGSANLHWLITA